MVPPPDVQVQKELLGVGPRELCDTPHKGQPGLQVRILGRRNQRLAQTLPNAPGKARGRRAPGREAGDQGTAPQQLAGSPQPTFQQGKQSLTVDVPIPERSKEEGSPKALRRCTQRHPPPREYTGKLCIGEDRAAGGAADVDADEAAGASHAGM